VCEKCDEVFSSERGAREHLLAQAHSKPPPTNESQLWPRACAPELTHAQKPPVRTHTGATFPCKLRGCGKVFASAAALASHAHPRDFLCSNMRSSLNALLIGEHVAYALNLRCSYTGCARVFVSPRSLSLHVTRKHRVEGTCACAHCPQAFAAPHLLRKHLAQHHAPNEAKPTEIKASLATPCCYCGVKEARGGASHERRHETETPGELLCTLLLCNLKLPAAELRPHLEAAHGLPLPHCSFSCDYCGLRLGNKDALAKHVAKHLDHRQQVEEGEFVLL